MDIKKIIIGLIFWVLACGNPCIAQEEDLSAEDLEAIEILDVLDNLDMLEEDFDFLEVLSEIGDDDED